MFDKKIVADKNEKKFRFLFYKFTPYTASTAKSKKRSLLNAIEFSKDPLKAEREKALLLQAIS